MAHEPLVAALVGETKALLARILDAVPGESDPFKVATAFLAAKQRLAHLESLVESINDVPFSTILGAYHGQAEESSLEADHARDPEAERRPEAGPGEE